MSKSPEKLVDETSRKIIKENINESLFVEAGAGSGKTTELVNRMVNMVKSGIGIDKICAITFTKAAANEFYSRFKNELEKQASAGDSRCRDALTNIDLCFMGTIDSFSHMIISEHPKEAGVPSGSQLLDDDMKAAYYRHVYSDVQKGIYGNELRDLCRQYRGFNGDKSEKIFVSLVAILMEHRNAVFDVPAVTICSLDVLYASEKKILQGVYTALKENSDIGYKGAATAIKAWDTFLDSRDLLFSVWDDNIPGISYLSGLLQNVKIAGDEDIKKLGIASDAFEYHESKQKRHCCYILKEEYSTKLCKNLKEFQYALAMTLAQKTTEVIVDELKKGGMLSYFDYQYYLLQMLRKDAASGGKLIRHIYKRHSYFLLDEFQDTDPMQAQIFFYLSAETINAEWDKCIPHKGSLFIVGDPKQSIYRFRNADVGAYKKVKDLFKGSVGSVVTLPCNFRSTKTMCSWFNDVFSGMLPEDTAEQSRFDPIPLDDKKDIANTFGGVYKYSPYFGTGDNMVVDDPRRVVEIINQLVENPEYLIQEEKEKDKAPRQIRYKDIMVITSAKERIKEYISLFAKERIPYKVEGSAEFKKCPSLVEICKLYSAVACPNDTNRLYVALTGKSFGISNSRLLNAVDKGLYINVFADGEKAAADSVIGNALKGIKCLYYRSLAMSPAALFSVIMDEYRVFEKTGADNAEYAYYAQELLRQKEASGSISTIREGADFLQNLIEGESGLERIMSLSQDEDRVHIANLHKVKGLEAPIVILATATYKTKITQRVDLEQKPPKGWIFAVKKKGKYLLSAPGYETEKDLEKNSQSAEHLRLLYVAATRARRALIMGCQIKEGGEAAPSNYWYELLNKCNEDFETLSKGETAVRGVPKSVDAKELLDESENNIFTDSRSNDSTYEIKLPSRTKVKRISSSEDEYEDETDEAARSDAKKKNAALVGTMVHRLMELMVISKASLDTDSMIYDILSEHRADEAEYEDMLKKVASVIRSGGYAQTGGTPKDILNELLSADDVYCEVPFCHQETGSDEIWNGVMDVIYNKDGKWHIIDYKTDAEVKDIAERHEDQLNAYIKAFKVLTGEDADARIYHISV